MKIYFDTCVYCRPLDDQTQNQIKKETEAFVKALIDRLGYANAARFIAILGGEGDSVRDIRARRMKSDIDEIAERIKRRKSGKEMKEESKGDYYRDV